MRCGLPLVLLLAACGDDAKIQVNTTITETFEQSPSAKADILWVVDNSISMEEEQAMVMDGAGQFVDTFDSTGMDFHLGVITTDTKADGAAELVGNPPYLTADTEDYTELFRERVDVGIAGDDQEKGFQAAITALTEPLVSGANAGFLREDATLAVIVLSDEDDCSDWGALGENSRTNDCYEKVDQLTPVTEIAEMFRGLKADPTKVTFSGIIGPTDYICPTATFGNRYEEAIGLLDGYKANICATDYTAIMRDLGLVASGLLFEFTLSYRANDGTIEVVVTNEAGAGYEVYEDADNGWIYDADGPTLKFVGDGVPPRGSTITVTYQVTGSVVDPGA